MNDFEHASETFNTISWNQRSFPDYVASLLPLEASLISIIVERFNHDGKNPLSVSVSAVEHQFQTPADADKEIKLASKNLLSLQLTTSAGLKISLIPHFAYNMDKQLMVIDLNPAAFQTLIAVHDQFPDFDTASWRELESRHTQLTDLFLQSQPVDHGELSVTRQQLADQFGVDAMLPSSMITKYVVPKIKSEFVAHQWFPNFKLQATTDDQYKITW